MVAGLGRPGRDMKWIIALLPIAFTISSLAQESAIELHLECQKPSAECLFFSFASDPDNKILLRATPEMIISKADVREAARSIGELNEGNLLIRLNPEASERFAELTANNLYKKLAIMVNGKIIMAPQIQSPVTEGSFQIHLGGTRNEDHLNHLPWLKKMTEDKESRDKLLEHISMALLVSLGIFILGGCVYFGFLRKTKS